MLPCVTWALIDSWFGCTSSLKRIDKLRAPKFPTKARNSHRDLFYDWFIENETYKCSSLLFQVFLQLGAQEIAEWITWRWAKSHKSHESLTSTVRDIQHIPLQCPRQLPMRMGSGVPWLEQIPRPRSDVPMYCQIQVAYQKWLLQGYLGQLSSAQLL